MRAIILGAGPGFPSLFQSSGNPKAIHEITQGKKVLDILIENFKRAGITEIVFVGGYQIEKVIGLYPDIKHYFNPKWESTNSLYSLYICREELEGEVLVSYADTLYSSEIIEGILSSSGDIRLSEDILWKERYEGRGRQLLDSAEKIISRDNLLKEIGREDISAENASGEFTGLTFFSARGSAIAREKMEELIAKGHEELVLHESLIELYNSIADSGFPVNTCPAGGKWAELEAPQDVAQFVFGTKAETLDRLQNLLTLSMIEDQVRFSFAEWRSDCQDCLSRVRQVFTGLVVVRSSAIGEDSFESSNAGEFLSLLNVDSTNAEMLRQSIEQVFKSYQSDHNHHQCLIQPQLENVQMSGVIFTRDLELGSPYYIINYEDSDKTDGITSGSSKLAKTFIYYKFSNLKPDNEYLFRLIEAVREVEQVVGYDSLDIEFAVTPKGIHILQVRPLVANRKTRFISDGDFSREISSIRDYIRELLKPDPFIGGKFSVLANMPDWNPAEIIGTMPKPLALSLYQYLITDEIWRLQRKDYAYRDSFPAPLVLSLSGQPYIDARASFNSFIPAAIPEAVSQKLLNFYLEKLANNPHLHDKVEFEIGYTCFSFDVAHRLNELNQHGFNAEEIEKIFVSLLEQTKNIIDPGKSYISSSLKDIERLNENRKRIEIDNTSILGMGTAIYYLLEDCKRYGTLPFAKLARCAFIATDILKSLVRLNIITVEEYHSFLSSVKTVAGNFSQDLIKVKEKKIELKEFLQEYGHLRPGTYDITSKRYDQNPEFYFSNLENLPNHEHSIEYDFPPSVKLRIGELIEKYGLGLETDQLLEFIRLAIQNRESSKFEFTRNLSEALKLIENFGAGLGISAEDISYVPISYFTSVRKGSVASGLEEELKMIIGTNKLKYNITRSIKLPHLIRHEKDAEMFFLEDGKPNYITEKTVTAALVNLSGKTTVQHEIAGKVVLINNADPGYDWIFGHNILGLITIYGGANSHMAIRAAEFGLPAAIGCGEQTGSQLQKADLVELNCSIRQIRIISFKN